MELLVKNHGYVGLLVTNWLCGITGYKVVIWNYWLKLVMWNYWLKTGYMELLVKNWLYGITG